MADIVVASTSDGSMDDYPLWLQAVNPDPAIPYDGQADRLLHDLVLNAGVGGLGDLRVTQRAAGANLTIDIAAGKVVIPGTSITAQGKYIARSRGTVNSGTNLTVPGAGTRTHRVIARARDKAAAGTTYGWSLEVLEDTGGGMPALPASAIDLASVAIPSGTASITNAMITDRRTLATGATLSTTTLAAPASAVSWDGIPDGIGTIMVDWTARTNSAVIASAINIRINQISAAGSYFGQWGFLSGNPTVQTLQGGAPAGYTEGRMGVIPGTLANNLVWASGRLMLNPWNSVFSHDRPNYTYVSHMFDTPANSFMENGGFMAYFPGPYTRIDIFPAVGSFPAGSQFRLRTS